MHPNLCRSISEDPASDEDSLTRSGLDLDATIIYKLMRYFDRTLEIAAAVIGRICEKYVSFVKYRALFGSCSFRSADLGANRILNSGLKVCSSLMIMLWLHEATGAYLSVFICSRFPVKPNTIRELLEGSYVPVTL